MNTFDTLLGMMILGDMLDNKGKLPSIKPFEIGIEMSPTSIKCYAAGKKEILEDIPGGVEWYKETAELVDPILKEQATKFSKLIESKFNVKAVVHDNEKNEEQNTENTTDKSSYFDLLAKIIGGGGN